MTPPPRSVAKPIVPFLARAGDAVADLDGLVLQLDAPALCSLAAEQIGGAGGGIDLVLVVHFQHFDIPAGRVQRLRRLTNQNAEQVHAEAHVAGLDDAGMAGGGGDLLLVLFRQARRADDMDDARLRRQFGEIAGGGGRGEIDDAVCGDEGLQRIVSDRDAQMPKPAISPISLPSAKEPGRSIAPETVTPGMA